MENTINIGRKIWSKEEIHEAADKARVVLEQIEQRKYDNELQESIKRVSTAGH